MNPLVSALTRWAITALLVTGAVLVALALWHRYEDEPWTRDGHVRADVVRVSADVGGLVTQVLVRDNQPVKVGQLLFVLDRPRFEATLAQATAAVASAHATLNLSRRESARDVALDDLVAKEAHEQNVARVLTASAGLDQAIAERDTAALNVRRTEVRSTVNGTVTNLDFHPGDYLAAGAQAMALIDSGSLRVEGYFEETKLHGIHPGDPALIRLMGDAQDLQGHVESVAAGIATTQATNTGNLLPSIEPTFSWVRLAQRIPVRIHVDRMPQGTMLIPGRTATVTVLPRVVRR